MPICGPSRARWAWRSSPMTTEIRPVRRPRTIIDKIWDDHVVVPETPTTPAVLYVDLHLIHEVTSPQAFAELESRGLTVRHPDRTVATVDHSIPTLPGTHAGT